MSLRRRTYPKINYTHWPTYKITIKQLEKELEPQLWILQFLFEGPVRVTSIEAAKKKSDVAQKAKNQYSSDSSSQTRSLQVIVLQR